MQKGNAARITYWADVLRLFVDHGADCQEIHSAALDIIQEHFPDKGKYLRHKIRKMRGTRFIQKLNPFR